MKLIQTSSKRTQKTREQWKRVRAGNLGFDQPVDGRRSRIIHNLGVRHYPQLPFSLPPGWSGVNPARNRFLASRRRRECQSRIPPMDVDRVTVDGKQTKEKVMQRRIAGTKHQAVWREGLAPRFSSHGLQFHKLQPTRSRFPTRRYSQRTSARKLSSRKPNIPLQVWEKVPTTGRLRRLAPTTNPAETVIRTNLL